MEKNNVVGEGSCHGMRRRRGEDVGIKQVSHWGGEIHLDMSKVYFNHSYVVKPWSGRGHLSFFCLLRLALAQLTVSAAKS